MVDSAQGVEGDVAVLASQALHTDTDTCLVFDLFLVLSISSSEDKLRIKLATSQSRFINSRPVYEITNWKHNAWQHVSVPLPQGKFAIQFEYTTGMPYSSVVAIDNVQVQNCQYSGLNHTDSISKCLHKRMHICL